MASLENDGVAVGKGQQVAFAYQYCIRNKEGRNMLVRQALASIFNTIESDNKFYFRLEQEFHSMRNVRICGLRQMLHTPQCTLDLLRLNFIEFQRL